MTDDEIRDAEVEVWASSVDWENDVLLGRAANRLGWVVRIGWNVFRCGVFAVAGHCDFSDFSFEEVVLSLGEVAFGWAVRLLEDFLKDVLPEGVILERE